MNGIGEIRPDIGPAIVGFRERKIAKAEVVLEALNNSLVSAPYAYTSTLNAYEATVKEIEIQKCYLQHENIGAI